MGSSYSVLVTREDWGDGSYCYTATHPELSGCRSQGSTPEEAKGWLTEAREMYLDALRSANLPIPEPSVIRESGVIRLPGYSG